MKSLLGMDCADPAPYTGNLRRSDGRAPYNGYFWPFAQDDFWPPVCNTVFHFCVVPLNNGRWLAGGSIRGQQFPTREAALRHCAARQLRKARAARKWCQTYRVSQREYVAICKWIFRVLKRPKIKPFTPKPMPPGPVTLLDIMEGRAAI